ncbi:2'-5'-oligoadenylate synthase-like protein [Eubalaena glacialis]|uniref:2'-5'-oligoadenylate synthase-like protein n=1 Tax=Eubalaena glacialis TaxID=27606 RepID=UPI002A5A961C|nr:2'-5'-oligoadenylate synthase-like protein [Eubalaena glacialis]
MAVPPELFVTPASRLNSFVAHSLHPSQEWKKEVLETVQTVEQFLREQSFQGEHGLDQELWVLKVVKVGSFGNGTVLRDSSEVELVMVLSGFHSFQEEARRLDDVLSLLCEKLRYCQDLRSLQLQDLRLVQGVPSAVAFTIQSWETAEPITVTVVPAYGVLGPSVPNSHPSPEVYVSLIKACGSPGHFSPSFSELQRNFVKHRPAQLKSLLRLVKHWYLECVKTWCLRAELPPLYALELLTVYAWEVGTQEKECFRLDRGLATVMSLLQQYQFLCIYWTKYYTFQNPIIEDFVRKQLRKERPIILDPADPTHNVAKGYRWDIVAQRACQCLKQDCCYDNNENPVPRWNVKGARDIQVTVEQWGFSDFIITVNPYDSIKKVKGKIQGNLGSTALQRLSFQEPGGERQLLSSQYCLANYGVFSNTRICLLQTISPEIQVFVKNPSGGSHAYAICPDSLVLNLKLQIEFKEGLLRKEQQLEFQGQVLQDGWSLRSCGVQDSTTLTLKKEEERGKKTNPASSSERPLCAFLPFNPDPISST